MAGTPGPGRGIEMEDVTHHSICWCGSGPAKYYDRLFREAICSDCVDDRFGDGTLSYPRFSRIYTSLEIEQLRDSYPLEQRLAELDSSEETIRPLPLLLNRLLRGLIIHPIGHVLRIEFIRSLEMR